MRELISRVSRMLTPLGGIHRQGTLPNIFIFSAPRTGSTFLMEILSAQPGMRVIDEPFNMNIERDRRVLGVNNWADATAMPDRRTVYERYVRALSLGAGRDFKTPFWSLYGRLYTSRTTFKVLHAGEDMLPWFEETFGALVVLLIRHPIPTVLSHAHHPRLDHYLRQPEMRAQFRPEHLKFAEQILTSGNAYERGVLDWCMQYYPAFVNGVRPSWTVISYEDLTVEAEVSVHYLEQRLQLAPVRNLQKLITTPSESTDQSDAQTVAFLKSAAAVSGRQFLIEKWRQKADEATERRTFEILDGMGLDLYRFGDLFPADKYRVPALRLNRTL